MMMERTADLTVYQKILIDTLHKEDKLENVITERTGCLQSAVSKHVGKLTGREMCGRLKTCKVQNPNYLKPSVQCTVFMKKM